MKACIAWCSNKGGVSKSTQTIIFSQTIGKVGRQRVLVIDLDPQCSTTSTLCPNLPDEALTLYDIFVEGAEPASAVFKAEACDVIPGDKGLANKEISLISERGIDCYFVARRIVEKLRDDYDWIFIDTPPELGLFMKNAVIAATGIMIPVKPDRFSMEGLVDFKSVLEKINAQMRTNARILGVVLNDVDTRMTAHRQAKEHLPAQCGRIGVRAFQTVIRRCSAISDSITARVPLFEYDPKCNGMKDYNSLIRETVEMIGKINRGEA